MMYQNKVIACIKVNGKILREDKDIVTLPFGTEYSILVKNLNPERIQVKIDIDGKEATGWVVINGNDKVEIERFVTEENMKSLGNKFKFIERTQEIEDHRGIEADDGVIRIEYKVEKKVKYEDVTVQRTHYVDNWRYYWPYRYHPYYTPYTCTGGLYGSCGYNSTIFTSGLSGTLQSSQSMQTCSEQAVQCSGGFNNIGITVPGSESTQKFEYVSGFDTHGSEILVIRLKGKIADKEVLKPVTVEDKKYCSICGKKNKYQDQFCSGCGTALTIH